MKITHHQWEEEEEIEIGREKKNPRRLTHFARKFAAQISRQVQQQLMRTVNFVQHVWRMKFWGNMYYCFFFDMVVQHLLLLGMNPEAGKKYRKSAARVRSVQFIPHVWKVQQLCTAADWHDFRGICSWFDEWFCQYGSEE